MQVRPTQRARSKLSRCVFAVLALALAACGQSEAPPAEPSPVAETTATPETAAAEPTTPTTTPSPTPTATDSTFTILAAGDVLPHDDVLASAQTASGWDFTPLWESTTPWVSAADLALCHLEVPIAPDGVTPVGYPLFASPAVLTENLAQAGWDGCSTASNHAVDQGWQGVVATLDALDAAGLGHVGTARTESEANQPQIYRLQRAGRTVTVAQLSATFSTNGLPIPQQAPWSVQLLDATQLIDQATAARASGADLVVASLHWGQEYLDDPVASQTDLAATLAASGVIDLVIGTHPHVPEPIVKLDGGVDGNGMWVAYSLGNYLSNQDTQCCRAETNTGAMLWATVDVPIEGPVRIGEVSWTGVTVDRTGGHRMFALPDLIDGSQIAPTLTVDEATAREGRIQAVLGETPERTEVPVPTGSVPTIEPRTD